MEPALTSENSETNPHLIKLSNEAGYKLDPHLIYLLNEPFSKFLEIDI